MFYDIFRTLAERNKISVHRAAQDIGLSKSTATKWKKTGATPSGDTLTKIADYFNVTVDYLLTGEESTQKEKAPISNEDLKFALFGRTDIDDKALNAVKKFARFVDEEEDDK